MNRALRAAPDRGFAASRGIGFLLRCARRRVSFWLLCAASGFRLLRTHFLFITEHIRIADFRLYAEFRVPAPHDAPISPGNLESEPRSPWLAELQTRGLPFAT